MTMYNIPEQPVKIPMPPVNPPREKKSTDGLRPCIVTGHKAYFHCWEQFKNTLSSGREVSHTLGIIEREDGTIHKCYPDEIHFTDREE